MTVKLDLPYLSAETDRNGKDRLYVRRNGRRVRIREAPGTAAFARAYAEAVDSLNSITSPDDTPRDDRPAHGTLGWLALTYFACPEFRALNPDSQATRRRVIEGCLPDLVKTKGGMQPARDCPLGQVTSSKIRQLRDLKIGKPGAANNRRKYLSAMFGWAIEADLMGSNPARDVRSKKYATSGFYTWSLSDLTAFENRHPVGTKARLAMGLLLYLGVRRGDLVRLGERHRHGQAIKFTPNKTRHQRVTESEKPILHVLEQIITASPCGKDTFLETDFGKPFTANGFGNWFRKRCDEAGLLKCSAHGLRKIGATLCAENGATEHQLMAIFDWSTPAQAATYTKAASRRALAAGSMHLLGSRGVH